MDFVSDMIKHDTEELARGKGLTRIDETAVQLWGSTPGRVAWSDEAWKRLKPRRILFAVASVRRRTQGLQVGAERVDSEHLTTFRNQAMMKAVKRIGRFGYNELTFDAFDAALRKQKRLQGNSQAENDCKRSDRISAIPGEETGRWYLGAPNSPGGGSESF